MIYLGKTCSGVVVFEGDQKPPDGLAVRVETLDDLVDDRPIGQKLLDLAGVIKDGPTDGSINHDHYLYGVPKK